MAIKINLSKILGAYRITQKELSEATGIRPATISMLYNEVIRRLEIDHLEKLCAALDCQPSEILEYIPDKEPKIKPLSKIIRAKAGR